MASKKGQGYIDEKQPAPKILPKRPAPALSSSKNKGNDAVQQAIVDWLLALEQSSG